MHAAAMIFSGIVVPMMAVRAAWADGNEAEFVLPAGLWAVVTPEVVSVPLNLDESLTGRFVVAVGRDFVGTSARHGGLHSP